MLDDGRRLEVLAAIGIDVYRLRAPAVAAAPVHSASQPADSPSDTVAGPRLAIACSAAARREPGFARASAHLSLEQQASATIAVSAEGAEMFRDAAARRATWQALKPLVRRLRTA